MFAVSGALLAAERKQTFVTFVFFAVVTGVGGGTLRDLLIGAPVFWVHTNATLLICIGAALLTWLISRQFRRRACLLWFDAAGLAAYATYGAAKALSFGVAPVPAFVMGVLTACAGGIIRDVLAGEPSILMRPGILRDRRCARVGPVRRTGAPRVCRHRLPEQSPRSPGSACAGLRSLVAGRCPLTTTRLAALQHGRHDKPVTEEFYRIKRLPPYVFAEVNAMKAAARARGEDIIDLGMGNPDGAPPKHVIDKLAEVAAKPNAHRYSASRGIPGLRKAQAAYYKRRFGVTLDPDKEVIVTLGLQGRPRQPCPGDHRARRCRAGAEPVLPDPQLRLHHRRRSDPLDPGRARRGILRAADKRRPLYRAASEGAW